MAKQMNYEKMWNELKGFVDVQIDLMSKYDAVDHVMKAYNEAVLDEAKHIRMFIAATEFENEEA